MKDQTMLPKYVHIRTPTTCEHVPGHAKRTLAALITLKMLRGDNYPGVSRRTQCNHEGPRKRDQRGDVTTDAEVPVRGMWSWRNRPQAKAASKR